MSEESNRSNSNQDESYTTNLEITDLRCQIQQMQFLIIQSGFREHAMQFQIESLRTQLHDSTNYYYTLCKSIQYYASVITQQNKIIKDLQNKYYILYNNYSRSSR
jgi:hypothetical protein